MTRLFPENLGTSVGAHLSRALHARAGGHRFLHELFATRLDAEIQRINQPVAVFIDNIEDAVGRHSGIDLLNYEIQAHTQSGAHSYDIWLAAQIGFISAVRELSARNAHVKIFGTVRSEAIRDNCTSTAFNVQAMLLDLRYTPADLRGIFETKLNDLRQTSPMLFRDRLQGNPITAFLGTAWIEHRSVVDAEGKPLKEDIFEYLRRHTRGRPRELDLRLGHGLQMIEPGARTTQAVRDLVLEMSYDFFKYAKNESLPYWQPSLDVLLQKIPSNFIARSEAERIAADTFNPRTGKADTFDERIGKEVGKRLWTALYTEGLCGAVVNVRPGEMEQRFANHSRMAELSEGDFRSAETWVLHPCVNIATLRPPGKYRPNRYNVAGHAYRYIRAPKQAKQHVHVLLGAGRLGLGLVTPMILSGPQTKVIVVTPLK